MSKPSALTPTLPAPTTIKALPSLTSSATRKRWQPMSRPSALTPTMLAPTMAKAVLSITSSATRKRWQPMSNTSKQEIKLFYCYAHEDKPIRDELEKHLSWLRRRYQLINWHDREIMPGEEWEQAIDMHLNTANLILLLISSDFMNSDYCYGKEMRRALERHRAGTCRVIPILLRPTYWEDAPFSSLQLLPTDARPITRWSDRDEAFQDVVTEISRTIKDLLISLKTKEEWIREGNALNGLKRYEEALAAYEQAIRLDPNYTYAYYGKGFVLNELKRYKEAEQAFEKARQLE